MDHMLDRYATARKPIRAEEEKEVEISEMYVYPIRGVRAGGQVKHMEVGRHGIKYDGELVLIDAESKKVVTVNLYHPMACLSQVLRGRVLEISTSLPARLTA